MYRIDILTLFDETVGDVLSESILGRAQERDLLCVEAHQIRDYTTNRQNQVDDYPYGGGHGAILQADPLYRCWQHAVEKNGPGRTIFLSPAGKTFTQADAKRLSTEYDHLILVCGHYEGIDQRFVDACVDEEISLGDFVLTGGEIPAMAIADSVSRLLPGVLGDPECFEDESHWNGLLEYPQFTRPETWHDRAVPADLLTGSHAGVARWRRKQALLRTRTRRPDMFAHLDLSAKEDRKLLAELEAEEPAFASAPRKIANEDLPGYGVKLDHEILDTGEVRFRLSGSDGSGYIRAENPSARYLWENGHSHAALLELVVVQSGQCVFCELEDGAVTFKLLSPGDTAQTRPGVPHTICMDGRAAIHTVKFGDCSRPDWLPCPELDQIVKPMTFADGARFAGKGRTITV